MLEEQADLAPSYQELLRSIWGHLAIVALNLGRPDEAKTLANKSLEFFNKMGTKGFLATLKYRLALAEDALGEVKDAKVHLREAMEWYKRLGMKPDFEEASPFYIKLFGYEPDIDAL
jgi:tetratricopeptide (TPR) repeat protein